MNNLPEERLRLELEKCLVQADEPSRFFRVLDDIGALKTTFPELHALKDVPAGPPEYHQEGSAFEHTMLVLDEMKERHPTDELALLMALSHDLGKAKTPDEGLPSHPNHGELGLPVIENMANRLSMSNEQESAMKEASRLHMRLHDLEELRDATVLKTWQEMDFFHEMFDLMVADSLGREPEREWSRGLAIRRFGLAKDACEQVTGQDLIDEGHTPEELGGEQFGDLLHQRRVEHMRELKE